jgi:hypothetical protein
VYTDLTSQGREGLELYRAGLLSASALLWDLCLSPAPADVHCIKVLICEGADVDVVGEHGWRPLHVAAMNNDVVVVDTLIRAGADMEAVCMVRPEPPMHLHLVLGYSSTTHCCLQ